MANLRALPIQDERDELIPGSPDWKSNFGDHLDELYSPTCDAGDDATEDGLCPHPCVTVRNFPDSYGWLLVCECHRLNPGLVWQGNP